LRTVRMRAISRFASFSRAVFSRRPVTDWNRRLNSSCLRSCRPLRAGRRSCLAGL
jgi:hypothetical protein